MRVRVLYFGMLRDLFGCEVEEIDLPDDSRAEVLVRHVAAHSEGAAAVAQVLAIAVNREYARGSVVLEEGDEVALLPPVSGGSDAG